MSIRGKIDFFIDSWNEQQENLAYKEDLFKIHEGNLKPYIDKKLLEYLKPTSKSYELTKSRIAPINLLKKIISKLSQIYNDGPTREIFDSSTEEADQELLDWYIEKFNMNSEFDVLNDNFNLTKVGFVMPVRDNNGNPRLRVYPSHHFLVFSFDDNNPTKMDAVMLYVGEKTVPDKTNLRKNKRVKIFHVYSDDEFIAITSDKEIYVPAMNEVNNIDGVNIYGKIPGIYVNQSRTMLMPFNDTDLKDMVVLIPLLITDLNMVSMFTAFSIMYGIDIDDSELQYAPNAFWNLKSDPESDKKPEIGTIKPEADIEDTLKLIGSELSMWLNSRGVRPGQIGELNAESFLTGISKIVDEADTTENRKKQAGYFQRIESNDFWDLMINYIHPVWVDQGLESNQLFSPNAKVRVKFPEPDLLRPRSEQINDAKLERDAGFISTRRAMKNLNPEKTDDEIDEMISEIDGENIIEVSNGGKMAASQA